MPRIRCHYVDCILIDDGYCGAAAIEIDPDLGCMTYSRPDDHDAEEDWDDEEEELEEWDEIDAEEDDDELWVDDEEEF